MDSSHFGKVELLIGRRVVDLEVLARLVGCYLQPLNPLAHYFAAYPDSFRWVTRTCSPLIEVPFTSIYFKLHTSDRALFGCFTTNRFANNVQVTFWLIEERWITGFETFRALIGALVVRIRYRPFHMKVGLRTKFSTVADTIEAIQNNGRLTLSIMAFTMIMLIIPASLAQRVHC